MIFLILYILHFFYFLLNLYSIFFHISSIPRFILCGVGGVILLCSLIVLACMDQDVASHSFGHTGGMLILPSIDVDAGVFMGGSSCSRIMLTNWILGFWWWQDFKTRDWGNIEHSEVTMEMKFFDFYKKFMNASKSSDHFSVLSLSQTSFLYIRLIEIFITVKSWYQP